MKSLQRLIAYVAKLEGHEEFADSQLVKKGMDKS